MMTYPLLSNTALSINFEKISSTTSGKNCADVVGLAIPHNSIIVFNIASVPDYKQVHSWRLNAIMNTNLLTRARANMRPKIGSNGRKRHRIAAHTITRASFTLNSDLLV
jgi:hypothetical protein